MAERVVKVRLAAEIAGYERDMLEAARATREVGTEAEKLAQKKEAFTQIGAAAVGMGTAITAVTALSIKAAIDWESAWAGVTKTVDGSAEEMAVLEDSLRGLALEMPATQAEIAGVAEAAGQLGVAREDITDFTRTMINLGETTNLTADEAATSIAQLMNIMQTAPEDVDRLGATLVALGNNGASTEREIVQMAQRIAGSGALVGATEGEVLGLANALASMGVTAELGGGVASRVLQDLYSAVQTGGDQLKGFAEVAGVSSAEFARQFGEDPVRALDLFSKGLNGVEASGGNVVGTLSELGFKSTEEQRVLLQLKNSGDLLADSLDLQATAWQENTALTDEAAKRYETVESKLAIAGNAVRDAAIEMGETFLPAVSAAADGAANLAQMFGDLPEPAQGIISVLTAVVGVTTLVGGAALLAVPKVVEFKTSLETLGVTGSSVRSGMGNFLRFLGGPWGLAMIAATASTVAFNKAIQDGVPTQAEIKNAAQESASAMDMLRAATERGQVEKNLWGDYAQQLENLPGLLDRASESGWRWAELNFNEQGALDSIKRLGDALGEMAQSNLPAAQDAFRKLVAEFDLTDEQASQLLNEMPALRDELLEQATAAGVVADEHYLLKMAMGENETQTKTAAEAYRDAAEEASLLSDEILSLIESINESNGIGQDAVTTNARYQEALAGISAEVQRQKDEYEKANETLEGFNLSLDQNTASGSANAAQLAEVASAAQQAAAAQFEQDQKTMSAKDATDKYNTTLAAQRQAFIDSAIQAGYNADEVNALADQVFALPSSKEVDVLADTASASQTITDFVNKWNGVQIRASMFLDSSGGNRAAAASAARYTAYAQAYLAAKPNADGGLYSYQAFEDGGFAGEGIYQGQPKSVYKFAEPETVWEAFISGKPDERNRNIGIWQETGRRLGVEGGGSVSIVGAQISGTLSLGDGLVGFVDGRITAAQESDARTVSRGKVRR